MPALTDKPRVPPGQRVTRGFPALQHGPVPSIDWDAWRLKIPGLVEEPLTLDWPAFQSLPHREIRSDVHCVTGWSKLDNGWEGVLSRDLWKLVRPKDEVRFVMIHTAHGFTADLALEDRLEPDVLFAWNHNGAPLTREHGWPLRLVVPRLYFWKSAKWVCGVELLSEDRPGFWEQAGYHRRGDPWQPHNRYRDYPPGKDPWRV